MALDPLNLTDPITALGLTRYKKLVERQNCFSGRNFVEINTEGLIEISDDESTPDNYQINKALSSNQISTQKYCKLHIKLHKERVKVIDLIKNDPIISSFRLYYNHTVVAKKKKTEFEIRKEELFNHLLAIPSLDDVERNLNFISGLMGAKPRKGQLFPYNRKLYDTEVKILVDILTINGAAHKPVNLYCKIERYLDSKYNSHSLKAAQKMLQAHAEWRKGLTEKEISSIEKSNNEPSELSQKHKNYSFSDHQEYLEQTPDLFRDIIHFLNNPWSDIGQLKLRAENAECTLTYVKIIDLVLKILNTGRTDKKILFPRGTGEIRAEVLRCLPKMTSYEAFSFTLHPAKMRSVEYWSNPRNFCPERVGLHFHIAAKHFIETKALSTELPGLIATRANTAAGKSFLIKREYGRKRKREVKGVINPDDFKFLLKVSHCLLNTQVHDEGIHMFNLFMTEVVQKKLNYIVDTRLLEVAHLEARLLKPAQAMAKDIFLWDIDVPLETSLLRVLLRSVLGKDPCPALNVIVDGFILMRKERNQIIARVRSENSVKKYTLLSNDQTTAVKNSSSFTVNNCILYKEALRVPSTEEIQTVITKPITDELIKTALSKDIIQETDIGNLKKWIGKSLGQAVSEHAQGDH